jgi:hypothetical protein
VQALIDDCFTRLAVLGGGRLHFGRGHFSHNAELSQPDNTIISGEGIGTILDVSAVSSNEKYNIVMGDDCQLRDLYLLGLQDGHNKGGIKAGSRSIIRNIKAQYGYHALEIPAGISDVDARCIWASGFSGPAGLEYDAIFHASGACKNILIDGFYGELSDRGIEIEDGPENVCIRNGVLKSIDNSGSGYSTWALDAHVHDEATAAPKNILFENIVLDSVYSPMAINYESGAPEYCQSVELRKIRVTNPTTSSSVITGNNILLDDIYYECVPSASYQIALLGSDITARKCTLVNGGTGYGLQANAICSRILDCSIAAFQYGGISVSASAVNSLIQGNRIISTEAIDGIRSWAEGTRIIENCLNGGSAVGIRLSGNNQIIERNVFDGPTTKISPGTTVGHLFRNNIGYLGKGEIRVLTGSITSLAQDAITSIDNPLGSDALILSLVIDIATGANGTAPNVDAGVGSSPTTDYNNLFDDLPGETSGMYASGVTPGTQTVPVKWLSGASTRYLNISIKDADATGMAAAYKATVIGR